jgi:hypothetical protein
VEKCSEYDKGRRIIGFHEMSSVVLAVDGLQQRSD